MSAMMSYDEKHCIGQAAREEDDIDGIPVNEDIPPCDDKVAWIATDMMQV